MPGLRDRLRDLWENLTASPASPRSSNGASSFHLFWEMPRGAADERLVEASATLEVLEPPRVSSLYFWALQVDFADEHGTIWGGGHTGLQWNRRFPEGTAVNWGGYASQERGGAVLPGSRPDLFAFPGDPNTTAFAWQTRRSYRLRIDRSPKSEGAWRAAVTDLETGETTVIRELWHPDAGPDDGGRSTHGGGRLGKGYLVRPMVWAEVFAACDAPSVTVRWTDLVAVGEKSGSMRPQAVVVNYQSRREGGCANTSVRRDGDGFLQVTNTYRETEQGSRLELEAG